MGITLTVKQSELDIRVETLSQRERWLIERLHGYRDLELEIEGCLVALRSPVETPSMTIRPPDEDDPYVVASYHEPLQHEWQQEVAMTIEKHVQPEWQYVSVERVNKALRNVKTNEVGDSLSIAFAIKKTARKQGERVELTPTERAIVQHEEMQERVKSRFIFLDQQKSVIETALKQMERHYPDWHELLSCRYIEGEKYISYTMRKHMSEKLYRNERHRALQKFDKLAVGLR